MAPWSFSIIWIISEWGLSICWQGMMSYCVTVFYFQDAITTSDVRRGCFDVTVEKEEWKEKIWPQINPLKDNSCVLTDTPS